MAMRATEAFDYIAHIQKENGNVIELAGTRDSPNQCSVYAWLLERALDLGGWIISQHISEAETSEKLELNQQAGKPARLVGVPAIIKENDSVFGSDEVFRVYRNTYSGASLCTYKVTKEK